MAVSAAQLIPAALAGVGLAGLGVTKLRQLGHPAGARSLATSRNVAHLSPRQVTRTARRLRNHLGKHPDAAETGVAVGRLIPGGTPLRATWEDVAVAVMAPRVGKTTSLAIPAVLDAPGPVVATSNKADLWRETHTRRGGSVWTFDPQRITGTQQELWWNPLAGIDAVEPARRFASHFLSTVDDETKRDIWGPAARQLISAFALAANCVDGTVLDVYRWLCQPSVTEPADILLRHGYAEVAQGVTRIMASPDKTRDSVYITATVALQCLDDPTITAWVTRRPGTQQFDPHSFVGSTDTLHLLSKDGGGSAAPLVAALTDGVLRAAVLAAEQAGGRLDPPLVVVLDEAANVCRIADLPKLYSHLGSRNIVPLTILQSYAQGAQAWGHTGIKELWGAATVKLVGPGMDDASFAEDLSRLVGDHDVPTTAYGSGRGGSSRNRSTRRDRILSAADIRALHRGTALLFATGSRPALIRLQPWYRDKKWTDAA